MFLNKLLNDAVRRGLFKNGEKVCVAASGGPDSTALLTSLAELRGELKISVSACHVNHNLRGAESNGDMEFVKALAHRLSIQCFITTLHIENYRKAVGGSVQSCARELRYLAFRRLVRKKLADKVVTAHTADDNAETLLLNLIRGSGLSGLAGIPRVREEIYVRPFLGFRKSEIIAHLKETGTSFREDSSNDSMKYARNKVRGVLLPMLTEEFNTDVVGTLCNTAEIFGEIRDYLTCSANSAFAESANNGKNGEVSISRAYFSSLHIAVQREVLRTAVAKLGRGLANVSFEQIENVRSSVVGNAGGTNHHLGGITVRTDNANILLCKFSDSNRDDFSVPFQKSGKVTVGAVDCSVSVNDVPIRPDSLDSGAAAALMDADSIPENAVWRNRREGDIFWPLGSSGSMKLKKFLIDKKIPRWKRDSLLLLASGDNVLWIAGHRISESVKIKKGTANFIKLTLEKLNPEN
ncbi:MAG: tRNA lysidine(34) synthetase TilS [Nitrospinae bacterium]|nr:tRNA lysidine(34) synthetase TilS [Nitrospinota bacterium]